jgi:hypothetical protein
MLLLKLSTLKGKTRESGTGQATHMTAKLPLANAVTTFDSGAEEVILAQGLGMLEVQPQSTRDGPKPHCIG